MQPTLIRIPWSHYCRKAEWALTHSGESYRTLDLGLKRFLRWSPHLPEGTVPVLWDGHEVVAGSAAITAWANARRRPGQPPLYPSDAVRAWEAWADEEVGPVARRVAYRCILDRPSMYGRRTSLHLLFRAARPWVLGILKHYRARRFEEHDARFVPEALHRIQARLEQTGSGFLFGDHLTAADLATAALWEPILPVRDHPAREDPAWDAVSAYVRRIRPAATLRSGGRRARASDLRAWRRDRATAEAQASL